MLKYLKSTEVNISNILIVSGDFNIRDNSWDLNFPYHSSYSGILFKVADFLHLELSKPTEQVLTRYLDNYQDSNLVIDLMFLRLESLEHNNYIIYSDWRLTSDHAPPTIDISIFKEHCHMQVHPSGNNVPMVKPPPNHTSPPSTVATFLATRLMAVLQPSGYSIFHGRDTSIQLGLP